MRGCSTLCVKSGLKLSNFPNLPNFRGIRNGGKFAAGAPGQSRTSPSRASLDVDGGVKDASHTAYRLEMACPTDRYWSSKVMITSTATVVEPGSTGAAAWPPPMPPPRAMS
jgi:hypothetical protein